MSNELDDGSTLPATSRPATPATPSTERGERLLAQWKTAREEVAQVLNASVAPRSEGQHAIDRQIAIASEVAADTMRSASRPTAGALT